MKNYRKIKLFGKSLRTGLLFMCISAMLCVLTGCGAEGKMLSELQKEDTASVGGDSGDTASGYPGTAGDGGAEGAQSVGQGSGAEDVHAGQAGNTEDFQGAGQNTAAKEGENTGAPYGENQSGAETIYVHVCGEVKSPGVYELPAGSRFYEAVEAAGGFAEDACRDYLNMAASLADGSRLEIPSVEAIAEKEKSGRESGEAGGEDREEEYNYYTLSRDDAVSDQADGDTSASAGLVNINTADIAGLCALPGVGEGRAKAIIEYREKQGAFQKKEDIMEVSGIGEKMYARMEPYVTVE